MEKPLISAASTLAALATPGHAANHLAFALPQENALFSGDHVMAWSTSVVAPPDGSRSDSWPRSKSCVCGTTRSIGRAMAGGRRPQSRLRALISHRHQREAAIFTRLEAGPATIPEIVEKLYAGLDPKLEGRGAACRRSPISKTSPRAGWSRAGRAAGETVYRRREARRSCTESCAASMNFLMRRALAPNRACRRGTPSAGRSSSDWRAGECGSRCRRQSRKTANASIASMCATPSPRNLGGVELTICQPSSVAMRSAIS